jgi:hypothetical protein
MRSNSFGVDRAEETISHPEAIHDLVSSGSGAKAEKAKG